MPPKSAAAKKSPKPSPAKKAAPAKKPAAKKAAPAKKPVAKKSPAPLSPRSACAADLAKAKKKIRSLNRAARAASGPKPARAATFRANGNYIVFYPQFLAKLRREDPSVPVTNAASRAGQAWREMPMSERVKYQSPGV